ncbi:unnamed protein product [Linum trigynum]|uniref:Uncharacterized protein n=1 Tax=Linum trigynum TaxID=586398 RepID=A0AAV2E492_9ROSI
MQEVSLQIVAEVESGKEGVIVENAGEIIAAQGKEVGQDEVIAENVGGNSKKGKEVVVDSTPPVTPSALPSQEEFNKVINGAKSRSLPRKSVPILNSNAFELLCGRDIKLQAPQKKQGGREGLRSKGATKVATNHK